MVEFAAAAADMQHGAQFVVRAICQFSRDDLAQVPNSQMGALESPHSTKEYPLVRRQGKRQRRSASMLTTTGNATHHGTAGPESYEHSITKNSHTPY